MNELHLFLANTWFVWLGLMLALYVVLDGFDLGVGILSFFARDEGRRGVMMSTLGSVWDANETWLIVLGGTLFGAFPLAYGVVLHALSIPIALMLVGLIGRAVAFEMRKRAASTQSWNIAFGAGSLLAAVAQGYALGALIKGLAVRHGIYTGGLWDWLTPFSTLVAVGLSTGYTLLGATYLLMKTRGETQRRNIRRAWAAAWLMMVAAAAVILWTPVQHAQGAHNWFDSSSAGYLLPLPVAAVFAFAMLLRALRNGRERAPFLWSNTIVVLSLLGLALSLYPYVIPQSVTVGQAAASSKTLVFMLTGIGVLIPIILIYSGYQYVVFRARIEPAQYEHDTSSRQTAQIGYRDAAENDNRGPISNENMRRG
ncbi:MAG: cytochrome d ubiquinol oxidase subunit II [Gammaproteobacteria bacterium]